MAAEEALPYGRSPSRGSRTAHDTAPSEQRSFFGFKSGKKPQQKSASDKLVWFSPVHSSLLSPGREKTLQIPKKKVRQTSIFSIQSRAKGAIEPEEPTSPKVSCIGQVIAHKKNKDPFAAADSSRTKPPHSKPGSASPARFFTSPGRSSKWGSLFGSRKDGSTTPSSSSYDGDYGLGKQNTWAAAVPPFDDYFDRYTHDVRGSHAIKGIPTSTGISDTLFQKKGAHASYNYYDMHTREKPPDEGHINYYDADKHSGPEKSLEELKRHAKPQGTKQRLTYEELPSLHCGASNKQNMKISVEVVPETWLLRDGDKLKPGGISRIQIVPESSTITCREEPRKFEEVDATTLAYSCSEAQLSINESTECVKQAPYTQLTTNYEEYEAVGSVPPATDTAWKPTGADKENNLVWHLPTHENTPSLMSSFTHILSHEEDKNEIRKLNSQDGAKAARDCNQQSCDLVYHEKHDDDGEKYSLALPRLVEKELCSTQTDGDGKCIWSIFKGKKTQAFSAQPFSALILVGYDANHQPIPNDSGHKLTNDGELLKGIVEVGRLSFHGSGKYFQVLKGDAAFIRSRSATSHRTVIRLQRCNSDPCRPA